MRLAVVLPYERLDVLNHRFIYFQKYLVRLSGHLIGFLKLQTARDVILTLLVKNNLDSGNVNGLFALLADGVGNTFTSV